MGEWIGMPIVASEHGAEIDALIVYLHGIMLAALILWGAFFIIPLVRRRQHHESEIRHRGLRGWWPFIPVAAMTVAEMALLIGISFPYWERYVVAAPELTSDTVEVRVTGQQFQWNIHYPGADGVFGKTDPANIDDETNLIGLDFDDPNSGDDITSLNVMFLPVDRPAVVYLSTKDVIHSFNLTELRVKQDVIPGMRIPVAFTPTLTSAEFGRPFEIACAQLCGLGHYRMRGFLHVVTDEEYDEWLAQELERSQAERDADWLF
jgi:cytochrome c oxidase subunit 2